MFHVASTAVASTAVRRVLASVISLALFLTLNPEWVVAQARPGSGVAYAGERRTGRSPGILTSGDPCLPAWILQRIIA